MSHSCNFCNQSFQQKNNLTRHLNDNRCKMFPTLSILEIHNKIEYYKTQIGNGITLTGNHNTLTNSNNTVNVENINVIFDINTINKITSGHIEPEKMKEFIENYDYTKLNLFLSGYIKELICNKTQPQNHSVKYVTKNPPRFNSLVENKEGEKINVIKNLKDSCELLSEPVVTTLKTKLKECLNKYKKDCDFKEECDYEIKQISKELNKESVKKALSSVLQNDILTDIQMKLQT